MVIASPGARKSLSRIPRLSMPQKVQELNHFVSILKSWVIAMSQSQVVNKLRKAYVVSWYNCHCYTKVKEH